MKLPVIVGILLWAGNVAAGCFTSDVRSVCCPAACAAKNGPNWYRAEGVLRGCMAGLGCERPDAATIFSKCGC